VHQDVAAPEEVGGAVVDRQRFRGPERETDAPRHVVGQRFEPRRRRVDLTRDGVEPDDGEAEALGEAVGVPASPHPTSTTSGPAGRLKRSTIS
jgi:hypothetical protein